MSWAWNDPIAATTDTTTLAFRQQFVDAIIERWKAAGIVPPSGGFGAVQGLPPGDIRLPINLYVYIAARMRDGMTTLSPATNLTLPDMQWNQFGSTLGPMDVSRGDSYGLIVSWTAVPSAVSYEIWSESTDAGDPATGLPTRIASDLPPTLTTWTQNGGSVAPGIGTVYSAGLSTSATAAPAAPTVAIGSDYGFPCQISDDAFSAAGTDLVSIGALQNAVEIALAFYCDASSGDSTIAINAPMMDVVDAMTTPPTRRIEQLVGSFLWRRKKPRQFSDLGLWTPTDAMRMMITPADVPTLSPNFILPLSGSVWPWLTFIYDAGSGDWNYATTGTGAPDYSAQPDILDSQNAVGSGSELTPGQALAGDIADRDLFNQLHDVINLMIWTFDRPFVAGLGGIPTWFEGARTSLVLADDSTSAGYDFTPSALRLGEHEYSQFGSGGNFDPPATCYAAAVTSLTTPGFGHGPPPSDFHYIDGVAGSNVAMAPQEIAFYQISNAGTAFECFVNAVSWKGIVNYVWRGIDHETDFLVCAQNVAASAGPVDQFFQDTSFGLPFFDPAIDPMTNLPVNPFNYMVWETITDAAAGNFWGIAQGTTVFNPTLDPNPYPTLPPLPATQETWVWGATPWAPASVTKWTGFAYHD